MACTRRRVELLTVCAGATPRTGYAAKTTFRTSCRFRTSSSFRNEFICMYYRLLTTLGYREVCSRDQTCVVTRCVKHGTNGKTVHAKAATRVPGAHTLSTPARTRSPMYRVAPLKQLQGTMPTLRCSGTVYRYCSCCLQRHNPQLDARVGTETSRIIAPDPSTRRAGCLRSHRRLSSLL